MLRIHKNNNHPDTSQGRRGSIVPHPEYNQLPYWLLLDRFRPPTRGVESGVVGISISKGEEPLCKKKLVPAMRTKAQLAMETEAVQLVRKTFSIIARESRRGRYFVEGVEYNDFIRNDEKRYAVIKTIEIIGEAAKRLPIPLRQRIPDIPWKDISGMRDVLVHNLDNVDLEIVWDVARRRLPDLKDKIMRYIPMIEVLVDLPSNWSAKHLSDVADIYMGQSPPSSSYNENGKGVAFLQGKAEFGDIFPRNTKWTTQPKRISAPWSILISVRAPVGNVNISDRRYAIGRGLAEVRPKQHTDAWYLFFVLLYERPRLRSEASGTIFQSINKKTLQEFLILHPPLPEQRAIAHVLRTVQEAREATERVIAAMRDLKRSLMRHLFTYGPVPVDAADQVTLQDTPIGSIPAHWRVVRLGEVADFRNGINFKREDRGKGILTIDVFNMYTDDVYPRLSGLYRVNITVRPDHLLAPGDLLFVRSSLKREGVGWTALFPGYHEPVTFCGFLIRGRLHSKDILPEFIVHFLRFPPIRGLMVSKSGKVAITNINQGNLKAIPIPVPPFDEQRQIARVLQTVDRKIEAEEARQQALDDLFRSLLHHLMTAKMRLPAEFIAQFAVRPQAPAPATPQP